MTAEWEALVTRAVRDSGARLLSITGGEPLVRADALDVLAAGQRASRRHGRAQPGSSRTHYQDVAT